MQHPGRLLALGAGSSRAEDRSLPAMDLGLHEEIAERRMQRVRARLVMRTRRSSMSSSGETAISVWVS
jgi:hypothetical protein